jgi:hypothetical protein
MLAADFIPKMSEKAIQESIDAMNQRIENGYYCRVLGNMDANARETRILANSTFKWYVTLHLELDKRTKRE